uniref:Uncharacterized protein n=1 Tax=Tanacetum cinerariifolium TaxID=118510 RepID=A0A699GZ91_TANCI|nr:hypothetical protein [Tanacetum cinerariifolium]
MGRTRTAPVDLTEDEHVPAVNTEELFGLAARPRPPGKQRPRKKIKSDTSASTGGSSSSSQFGDFMTHELRLIREAAKKAFEVAKEKDRNSCSFPPALRPEFLISPKILSFLNSCPVPPGLGPELLIFPKYSKVEKSCPIPPSL